MHSTILKGKLHMARVTQAELRYDGSCATDSDLAALAGLRECAQIDIYNVNDRERLTPYVTLAEPGSGTLSINGAAARKVQVGDRVIIAAYGQYSEADLQKYQPRLVYLDENNRVERTSHTIPVQVA